MRGARSLRSGVLRMAAVALAVLSLSACQMFRHSASVGCTEQQVTRNIDNQPQLRVPPGLDAPDTRNGVHIPALDEPERPRAKTEPCLSMPPSYAATRPEAAATAPASAPGK
jgi:hypothetical protein